MWQCASRQFACERIRAIMFATDRSLDVQREEFKRARLIAMPIAGLIVWVIIGILGTFLSPGKAALALFIGTGSIAYLGMFISRFTGEHFLDRSRPKNTFDGLFFVVLATALQAYAIAIPFFMVMPSSLPLTVGVLSGMMWLPMSWILQHWIGIVHGGLRTVLVVVAWYMFPAHRFVVVPFVIVALYVFAIVVLELRWRAVHARAPRAAPTN
jgi:hypothetical protein